MFRSLCVIVITMISNRSMAFDPFTVATGARALAGIADGALGGGLEEAADAGIAIGDLMIEVYEDPTVDLEAKEQVRRLETLRAKVNEAKWTKAEVESFLGSQSDRSRSHADRVRQVQKMIRMTKKISGLFAIRPKAAEKANSLQQTQINYMILNELMAARQERLSLEIDKKEMAIRREALIRAIVDEEKPRSSQTRNTKAGDDRT